MSPRECRRLVATICRSSSALALLLAAQLATPGRSYAQADSIDTTERDAKVWAAAMRWEVARYADSTPGFLLADVMACTLYDPECPGTWSPRRLSKAAIAALLQASAGRGTLGVVVETGHCPPDGGTRTCAPEVARRILGFTSVTEKRGRFETTLVIEHPPRKELPQYTSVRYVGFTLVRVGEEYQVREISGTIF